MNLLQDFTELCTQDKNMPLLFIGHGSPMNGIEENEFSETWHSITKQIPIPSAVLVVSAHWYTQGTRITAMEHPKTIHDFYGFPQALHNTHYPAPGHPALAKATASLIRKTPVGLDHEWGFDHGTWTIVRHMYPEVRIPVLQLSIDYTKGPQYHYELAKELELLRKKGVLIIGSGNMIHNLRMLNWQLPDTGYDWAMETNEKFKNLILANDHQTLIRYESLGHAIKLSVPSPDHYLPMLYTLGLKEEKETVTFFNDKTMMGAISMTSFIIQ